MRISNPRQRLRHAANHRQLIRELRGLGKQLAELNPRHIGRNRLERRAMLRRRVRLWIPRVHMRHSTLLEQYQHAAGPRFFRRRRYHRRKSRQPSNARQSNADKAASAQHRYVWVIHFHAPDDGRFPRYGAVLRMYKPDRLVWWGGCLGMRSK